MWTALEHSGWVTALATSRWLYGLVSVVHYCAVFFSVGVIALLDLRILGVARRQQPPSAITGPFRSWTWIGLGIAAVSGFLLFATEAGEFAAVSPFRLKLLVILLAVSSVAIIERSLPAWEGAPDLPVRARLAALISLLLWLIAVLVSVEIPALTGLG